MNDAPKKREPRFRPHLSANVTKEMAEEWRHAIMPYIWESLGQVGDPNGADVFRLFIERMRYAMEQKEDVGPLLLPPKLAMK